METYRRRNILGQMPPPDRIRSGLIVNAKLRVSDMAELIERLQKKKPRSRVPFLDVCLRHFESTKIILALIEDSEMISDDAFLKVHDLLMTSLEHTATAFWSSVGWHGSITWAARNKAIQRHAHDPKAAKKILVKDCWERWQTKPSSYKSKAAFARDMLDKYEELTSQKVIEDWCRTWGNEKL